MIPLVALIVCLSACTSGFIYTDITLPLTVDMDRTPSIGVAGSSSYHSVKEPITSIGVTAEWSSYAIGSAAERGNLEELYFADQRVISYFGGVYKKTTVTVYGKLAEAEISVP